MLPVKLANRSQYAALSALLKTNPNDSERVPVFHRFQTHNWTPAARPKPRVSTRNAIDHILPAANLSIGFGHAGVIILLRFVLHFLNFFHAVAEMDPIIDFNSTCDTNTSDGSPTWASAG